MIFQARAPYLNTQPSPGLHTEPSGTPLFVPFPIPSVTQHTLTEHLPAVGSGVTKPVWVLYLIAEDYFMPSFLPSELPYLLPSPSSSLLSADDVASCLLGKWKSVLFLPPSVFDPGVNMLFFLFALELKMCLFSQMRPVPPSGLWIPFPLVLGPSLPSPSLIPLQNHSC